MRHSRFGLFFLVVWMFCGLFQARAEEHTLLLTMDASTTNHHHPAYPTDPDFVAELGTDCNFAWSYLKADSPDGCTAYLTSSTYLTSTPKNWSLTQDQGMAIMYAPFEQFIPAGATIISAKLGILARNNWYMGARDSLVVTNLTDATDVVWWYSKGVGDNPNQAHASWDHAIQGWQDSSNPALLESRGYPENSVGTWPWCEPDFRLWDLGRSQMSRFRGDECDGNGYNDADCGWAAFQNGHDIEIEMRRLVQAVVNGEDNKGIALVTMSGGTSPSAAFYHWDTSAEGGNLGGTPSDYKPFWVITYSDQEYQSYLPDGSEGAMVFTTDDGIQPANFEFAQAYINAGLPALFGLNIAEIQVGATSHHLTFDDLVSLRAQGVEIGSHSRWHASDPNSNRDGLTVYDPNDYGIISEYYPGMPPSELTEAATGWDSLLVDTDPIWLYEGLEQAAGQSYLDDPYVSKGFALPQQDFDMPAVRALLYHGYRYFRCGIAGLLFTNLEEHAYIRRYTLPWSEGLYVPADTFQVYCPTNGEPINVMGLPLTLELNELDQNATYDEASIKTWARHRMEVLMAQDLAGGILSIYTHDIPEGGTGWYVAGCLRPQWLTWILEEYQAMGNVWICRPRDLNDWIRATRTPIDTPSCWLLHDTWRWTAEDEVLYCGGGVPSIVGVIADPPHGSENETPSPAMLGKNYPNPFNPRTTVTIDLPRGGEVSLCVLDLRGRCVRVLFNQTLEAGRHQAVWDGLNDRGEPAPSGTYLFRVSTGSGSDTEKIALVR